MRKGIFCRKFWTQLIHETKQANLGTVSASLAYTTVLSIVPLLAFAFFVFQKLGGLQSLYDRIEPFLFDVLSEGTGEAVTDALQSFIKNVHANAMGWAGIAGLLLTFVSTYSKVAQELGTIFKVSEQKNFLKDVGRALLVLLIAPPLIAISISLTTFLATPAKALAAMTIPNAALIIGFLGSVIINHTLFSAAYKLIPRKAPSLKLILKGALLPAVGFEIVKAAYAVYTTRIMKLSAFYGSLAAIPMFLLWIYLGWYVTLFGAVWIQNIEGNQHEPKN